MKKLYTILISALLTSSCFGQVITLHENFDAACGAATPNIPAGWIDYNVIPPVADTMNWNCAATLGRDGTPGVICMGYYAGAYHLDTAYLFTPAIAISAYTDSVYLFFDSKYDVGTGGSYHRAHFEILMNPDSFLILPVIPTSDSNLTLALTPLIGPGDSSGWVTHQVDLSPYKFLSYVRVGFRYASSDTDAGAWTIDNVNTSPFSLHVQQMAAAQKTLNLIGGLTQDGSLMVYYLAPEEGAYSLTVTDMNGHDVLQTNVSVIAGRGNFTLPIDGVASGIYILRLFNKDYSAYSRVLVH